MGPQAGTVYIYEHVYSDRLGMVLERLGALRLDRFRKTVKEMDVYPILTRHCEVTPTYSQIHLRGKSIILDFSDIR